jgi:peptidoglycan hydrolase-like protein with peptidoglycan-binding domain
MEKLKFILLFIIIIAGIGLVGYWAVITIEPGNAHFYKEKQIKLEEKNEELQKEITELKNDIALLQSEKAEPAPVDTTPTKPTEKSSATTTPTTYKYQSLINDLQKLVDDNVFMKVGSQGTRVGTVQTFLNIYNKTTKKIDNDYGVGMKTDIANFQKAVGITADGEAGPTTYRKMIDWLKKQ